MESSHVREDHHLFALMHKVWKEAYLASMKLFGKSTVQCLGLHRHQSKFNVVALSTPCHGNNEVGNVFIEETGANSVMDPGHMLCNVSLMLVKTRNAV